MIPKDMSQTSLPSQHTTRKSYQAPALVELSINQGTQGRKGFPGLEAPSSSPS